MLLQISFNDIIGSSGVFLILFAYFASVFNLMSSKGTLFFVLNVIGSGLACYASWLIDYLPFVILEATWCLVSLVGLFRSLK